MIDESLARTSKLKCPHCDAVNTISMGEHDFRCPNSDFKCGWTVAMMHTMWSIHREVTGG